MSNSSSSCVIGVVVPSYCRSHLLKHYLHSVVQYEVPKGLFFIVINDGDPTDGTEEVCNSFSDRLDIRYLSLRSEFTAPEIDRRSPVFVYNIGFRLAEEADIIIKSTAEMYQMNDCIGILAAAVEEDPTAVAIPNGPGTLCHKHFGFDNEGIALKLGSGDYNITADDIRQHTRWLDVRLGFMMALRRDVIFELRGYDEDFIGCAYDDNDFIDRLVKHGCHQVDTSACAIHLYHAETAYMGNDTRSRIDYNSELYTSRKEWPVARNIGREWGVLPV